ncbi:ABC-type sugar transport system, permease component [Halobacteroides halobius DSM 5150]|uniref:ABC-type sugar transport system, permease component n=1 Tax=Halobacteroides halobius (strain ATCC 35273 / DSM 5150 / MD-1) TaxID=748449 RepID=L0K9P9_HALHC|nr:carbohydrate ABC transporter permease [Halobacteroides halobius]AGB41741.1 ABC-type sugar transport system, permease component [Halobacteroides halobius DSM 5150]
MSASSLNSYEKFKKTIVYILLIVSTIIVLFPFFWMISTALKTRSEILSSQTISLLPKQANWGNFIKAWNKTNFGRQFTNSMIMAITVTLGQIVTSAMAGYAFARFEFKGKKLLFGILLATLVVPFQMRSIPVYVIISKLGWLDSYKALIIPSLANAFGIFLFKQFFAQIPYALEEAALIDGASRWQILWKIMLPLSKPAAVSLFIFTFTAEWNILFKPLILTRSQAMRTVQLGLTTFQSQFSTNYALLMAAAAFVTIPVLILFLLGQRQFIQGVANTGID